MGAAEAAAGYPLFGFSRAPKSDTLRFAGMNSGDYTADAICQVMGLSGFVEEAWVKGEHPTPLAEGFGFSPAPNNSI